ncbi:MAG: CoA transferase [Pirellulales bacterium]|nr:CoA transferase [Pirellulales bacterium]
MPALDGIHVLDLSMLLPGPLCTQILRDLGARVTKIEPPAPGDYMALWPPQAGSVSAMYLAVNRGKQIVSLNLKQDADRERFFELARTADVVVEGFRPGVISKLGIGYPRLHELNPGIIVCSISGYGQTGPLADRAGHDLNYQALAGVLSISGGDVPANPEIQVADTCGGSYAAAMLIVAALFERTRTGQGRHLDVSMSEQLLPLLSTNYAVASTTERDPLRDGEVLSGGAPCYRQYRTADDQWFTVGALEPKFWTALLAAIDAPDLADVPHLPSREAPRVSARLAEIFATKTRADWEQVFAAADACCEPVLRFAEVTAHPHWQARQSFERIAADDGRAVVLPKLPATLAGMNRAD